MAVASKGENQVGIINKFNAKILLFSFKEVQFSGVTEEYVDNNHFTLNKQGECTQNCKDLEAIRLKANSVQK